jgi:hypothetical protein
MNENITAQSATDSATEEKVTATVKGKLNILKAMGVVLGAGGILALTVTVRNAILAAAAVSAATSAAASATAAAATAATAATTATAAFAVPAAATAAAAAVTSFVTSTVTVAGVAVPAAVVVAVAAVAVAAVVYGGYKMYKAYKGGFVSGVVASVKTTTVAAVSYLVVVASGAFFGTIGTLVACGVVIVGTVYYAAYVISKAAMKACADIVTEATATTTA